MQGGGQLEVIEIKYEDPIRDYAYWQVVEKWGEGGWLYFDDLVRRESGWKPTAQNPTSTAFGIMQFLNATWSTVGCEKTSDGKIQIDCGIKYVEQRYGTPQRAIEFHNRNNYY